MAEKCFRNRFVESSDADVSSHLRPSAFLLMAQSIAVEQVGFLNPVASQAELVKHNLAWVVSRARYVFKRMPGLDENFVLSSWHKRQDNLYYIRDYRMETPEGEELITGTSSWVILNLASRSVEAHWSGMTEGDEVHDDAIEAAAPRIRMPRGVEPELAGEHVVRYSDVDINSHANNTKYVDWAMDVLDYELTSQKRVRELFINYNHEVRPGETVQLYKVCVEQENGLCCYVEGKVNGVSSFVIELVY